MFDAVIDRRGSHSYKWDWDERITGRKGLLPFWVADMDFKAPPPVLEALSRRLEHGIFGYSARPDGLTEAMTSWFKRRHDWSIESEQILEAPGTVPFIHIFIQKFTSPGDSVIIQEPVYYPFRMSIERNKRQVVVNPLSRGTDGRWEMDLSDLERKIDESGAKTLIFCSPHNPVSRVWGQEELENLAELCRKKGVTVVSDEIHADLAQPGFRHIPWLALPEQRLPRSVAVVSATKSFNLPGLNTAWAVVKDPEFRKAIAKALENLGLGMGSSAPLSYAAAEAAWCHGDSWLDDLLNYVGENNRFLRRYFADQYPDVNIATLEGTYLAWLDFVPTGLSDDELSDRMLDAGVWLSRGSQFGAGGEGHLRMNLACPRSRLEEGLDLVGKALKA